jgi:hypothetical protein
MPNKEPMLTRREMLSAMIILPVSAAIAACGASAGSAAKPANTSALPAEVLRSPLRVREAYQFAVANPEALKNVPCYCGCGAMGHTSNYSCYVKQANADGAVVFDQHALGCSLCVDIAQDAKRLTAEGKSLAQVRSYIVDTYSKFGPSNQS